jgi:hypothetical protein
VLIRDFPFPKKIFFDPDLSQLYS